MNLNINNIVSEQNNITPKSKKLLTTGLKLIELERTNNKKTQNLCDWLLSQKDDHWIFNQKISLNFILIAALFKHCPDKFSGQTLAKILKLLTSYESQVGGPYFNENREIDLTTNLAIAYFLFLNEVKLPKLESFINVAKKKTTTQLDIYLLKKIYQINSPKELQKPADEIMITKLIKAAKQRFTNLNKDLKKIALMEIERTIKNNSDKQMSLISYYFKLALGKKGQTIGDDFIIQASLANIFYWTAFIIYDDFWDEDEKAIPKILPAANLYARHYIDFYTHALPENTKFRNFFQVLMDKLDAANTWETVCCRTKVTNYKFIIPKDLPDYKNYDLKFYPASGQILGPITLLLKTGFKLDSPEIKNVINFFKNYLIAMQINDDAHDWLEDMKRGHLSTVVVLLIKDWQSRYPEQKEIDLIEDLKKLQQLFWFNTVKKSSKLALAHTSKSRAALNKLSFLEDLAPLEHYINITEKTAKTAINEQLKSLSFLKEFK